VNTCGTIGSSVVGAARALLAAMTLGHMHAPIARIPVSSLSIQVFMGPGSCRWTYILVMHRWTLLILIQTRKLSQLQLKSNLIRVCTCAL